VENGLSANLKIARDGFWEIPPANSASVCHRNCNDTPIIWHASRRCDVHSTPFRSKPAAALHVGPQKTPSLAKGFPQLDGRPLDCKIASAVCSLQTLLDPFGTDQPAIPGRCLCFRRPGRVTFQVSYPCCSPPNRQELTVQRGICEKFALETARDETCVCSAAISFTFKLMAANHHFGWRNRY